MNIARHSVKLVAILKKPADQQELQGIIDYVRPDHVVLFLPSDGTRIDEATVRSWPVVADHPGRIAFEYFDRSVVSFLSLRDRLEHLRPFNALALPIGVQRAFYEIVPWARQYAQVIQISDGMPDSFGILGFHLGMRVKGLTSALKSLLVLPKYFRAQADLCFYPLYPLQSCFTRETRPAPPMLVSEKKRATLKGLIEEHKPLHLIVGGDVITAQELAREHRINRYIATTKGRAITVNGEVLSISSFICAEEVLEVFKPVSVVGTASAAVVAAKVRYPDVPCIAHTDGSLNKRFGRFNEQCYQRAAERVGVQVRRYTPSDSPSADYIERRSSLVA